MPLTCGLRMADWMALRIARRNALRDELRVGLRVLDLEDVELHLLLGELLEVAADAVRLGTTAADHDARARGVDVHPHAVPGALDLDLRDAGPLHALGEHAADLDVFLHVLRVLLVREPARLPVGRDAEPEPVRVDLLTHQRALPFAPPRAPRPAFTGTDSTSTVMWLVRLRIR